MFWYGDISAPNHAETRPAEKRSSFADRETTVKVNGELPVETRRISTGDPLDPCAQAGAHSGYSSGTQTQRSPRGRLRHCGRSRLPVDVGNAGDNHDGRGNFLDPSTRWKRPL